MPVDGDGQGDAYKLSCRKIPEMYGDGVTPADGWMIGGVGFIFGRVNRRIGGSVSVKKHGKTWCWNSYPQILQAIRTGKNVYSEISESLKREREYPIIIRTFRTLYAREKT